MHWIMGVLSMLVVAGIHGTEVTAGETNRSKMSLTVNLTDGSKLIGTTSMESLPVRSEALGKLNVPLAQIATVKFGKDRESVTLTMRNGDRLQGSLGETKLEMVTVFGSVIVPLDKVTEMLVRVRGQSQPVEWEKLPFPSGSDWPGPRGLPAVVEPEGMLIQGQPVRSRETFRGPVTVACDVTAEYLHAELADMLIMAVPSGSAKDGDTSRVDGTQQFRIRLGQGNQLMFGANVDGSWRDVWNTNLPILKVGEPHRLELELGGETLRVWVDGQEYKGGKAPSLPAEYYLQIWNWQPSSRWRVRNFNVR
jgi:hypothetical protein